MKYRDALEICLNEAQDERDLEAAIGAFPEHADRLRSDVALSVTLRRASEALPGAPVEVSARALLVLERELQTVRDERMHRPSTGAAVAPTDSFFGLPRFAPALMTLVLLVSLGVLGVFAGGPGALGLGGVSKVEALTFEGVVVESADGQLLLQTESNLEQISLPSDTILLSADGANLTGVSAGQVVVVTAKRLPKGPVTATRIQLQAAATVEALCSESIERCERLEQRLEQITDACPSRPASCEAQRLRLNAMRMRVAVAVRFAALKERCREGELAACRELADLCRARDDACAGIERRLLELSDVPPAGVDAEERLAGLRTACQEGRPAACTELRQLCEAHPLLCPQPQRPASMVLPRLDPTVAPFRVETNDVLPPRPLPASTATPLPPTRTNPQLNTVPRQTPPTAVPTTPPRTQQQTGR